MLSIRRKTMDGKIIIETKGKLANGNVLVCENGKARAMDVHALLPDLRDAKVRVSVLEEQVAELRQAIADLAKIVKEK